MTKHVRMCARALAYLCVCVCVARECLRMHACFKRYICVCGCMSVEETRSGERGKNARVKQIVTYLFNFKCSFSSPCVKEKFSFSWFVQMMNNKDLFGI